MCITEPSNNDYDNDGSDYCDYNFVTFDDFDEEEKRGKYDGFHELKTFQGAPSNCPKSIPRKL